MRAILTIPGFLAPAFRDGLLAEMRAAGGAAATVTGTSAGATVALAVRKVTRLDVSEVTREEVARRFLAVRPDIERHFGVPVRSLESAHFLRYEPGDYFVAHQDGNTPLVYDDTRFRKVSVVVVLSRKAAGPKDGGYSGGALLVHGSAAESFRRTEIAAEPGALVAFLAETTHEVTPVTAGERYSIASWYR